MNRLRAWLQRTPREEERETIGKNDVIAIPGLPPNEQERVGTGFSFDDNQEATMRIQGSHFTGAWTTNPSYYRIDHEAQVLHMRSVCWLSVHATCKNVKGGVWEPTIKIKCDNVKSFNALWSIIVSKNGTKLLDQSFRCNYAHDEGGKFLLQHEGQWIRLSFGPMMIPFGSDVTFQLFGNNPGWAHGIHFGDMELRHCGIEWEKEKILLLFFKEKARVQEEEITGMHSLPKVIICKIAKEMLGCK